MLPKVNIAYTFISAILFYAADTNAMLTRFCALNHVKKFNFRNYSITKENRDFKNLVTQQFTLKIRFPPKQSILYYSITKTNINL